MSAGATPGRAGFETVALGAVACGLAAAYAIGGFAPRTLLAPNAPPGATFWFGVDQWGTAGVAWTAAFLALAAAVSVAVLLRHEACRTWAESAGRRLDERVVRLCLAAAAGAVFWALSINLLNVDGAMLEGRFQQEAAAGGGTGVSHCLTHDEILELHLHYRLWNVARTAFGWDAAAVYRLTSCLAGVAAVHVALGFARSFAPARRPIFVACVLVGGWVQVFFGDVENYTIANAVVVAYLVAGLRFLADGRPVWPAFALLALAVVFHAETLIFGPSLLVLGWIALSRGRDRDLAAGVALFVGVVGGVVWWFHSRGLPIGELFRHSHLLADGGEWGRYLSRLDFDAVWLQIQLLLLLAPGVVLLPVLCAAGRIGLDRRTAFLATAALGAFAMHFLWTPQLGVYADWNLFAVVAQPIGFLVGTALAEGSLSRGRASWIAAIVVLAATHAGTWIVGNHLYSGTP